MQIRRISLLAALLIGCAAGFEPAQAQSFETLGGGFSEPAGVALDKNGNVYVADEFNSAVKMIPSGCQAAACVATLGGGFQMPVSVAVDSLGTVFVADFEASAIQVIPSGCVTAACVTTIGGGFADPEGVAIDGHGTVYVADGDYAAIKAIPPGCQAAACVTSLGGGFSGPDAVAVDPSGTVYVTDFNVGLVKAIPPGCLAAACVTTVGSGFVEPEGVAIDGNGTVFVSEEPTDMVKVVPPGCVSAGCVTLLGSGFSGPEGLAVDGAGNVYVADHFNNAVKEILAGPPTIFAAVLPGSRSVELGNPATIFATIINTNQVDLGGCQVSLPSTNATAALSMSYQTTDPATNALTGTPNTPVTIAGNNGVKTFLLSFQSVAALTASAMPLYFGCVGGNILTGAAIVPGVDTVDLVMSSTPVADIIALSATPTNNSIIEVPVDGAAAFAVATANIGVTDTITVSVDTGAATLPVAATICQSNSGSGQCLAPPTSAVTLSFAGGTTPTFSVFLQASGTIAFAPASSRVFVRFEDAAKNLHGSTSVAIETK